MYSFIAKYEKLAEDVYIINDVEKLNKNLEEINKEYDELMKDESITDMEKNYIFESYIKLDEINMYNVPIIKEISRRLRKRYDKYHCRSSNNESIGINS